MKRLRQTLTLILALCAFQAVAANLDVDTPNIRALTETMQERHSKLAPYYQSGVVGWTKDGLVTVRDAQAIPVAERAKVQSLIQAENQDRKNLYREIARANQHPEWEPEIQTTFAKRWTDKAKSGWWIQSPKGDWVQK